VFTKDFLKSSVILYKGLLVPQAWTLGVELSFYLIAPLILTRRKIVFVAIALSLLLRAYLIKIGIGTKDPWTYRFFPTELALFLLGSLSHQIVLPWYKKACRSHLSLFASVATYFLVGVSLCYFLIPIKEIWKAAIFIAIFLLLVPFTFEFQDRHKLDNWIGNLSYPIYVGHVLVIYLASISFRAMGIDNRYVYSLTCAVLAVGFAILLNRYIGAPFERIRDKFRRPS
jgi:peptidoglycan/LPS O-acetylase OafA/YrhL